MRTAAQIADIEKTFEDPYSIPNFISMKEIDHLISIYKNAGGKNSPLVYKNTGPVTLDLEPYKQDSVIDTILEKIKKVIGDYEITAAFFFQTDYPHIIHNDDTFELPETVYKGITIPLYLENFTGNYPKLCFFNQFYFYGPAKFFNGSENIPTYYNKQIYEYSEVDNLSKEKILDVNGYFTHLKPKWLEGLSFHSALDWIPGNILIFDSVRLHCSSDFRSLGIKSKLGISIFTKK